MFTPELIQELREMTRTAVEHETAWGKYIVGNQIPGLNDEMIDRYIRYLANNRMRRLGFEILYPEITEHPMHWVEGFSNIRGTKTDFFEQKVTNYTKASSLRIDDL